MFGVDGGTPHVTGFNASWAFTGGLMVSAVVQASGTGKRQAKCIVPTMRVQQLLVITRPENDEWVQHGFDSPALGLRCHEAIVDSGNLAVLRL